MSSPMDSTPWFAQLEDLEDPMVLHEFVGDCLVNYPSGDMGALMDDQEFHYNFSAGSECNSTNAGEISADSTKRLMPNDYNSGSSNNNSNGNSGSNQNSPLQQQHLSSSPEEGNNPAPISTTKAPKRPRRLPDQCQNHILAERQRRQNLSQLFIALSALIPGLKKMDKTSVLGEAITHMKELKEKLKILEEEHSHRAAIESVVVVQRTRVSSENDSNSSTSSDNHQGELSQDEELPEIEVRFSNKSALVKIHCHMRTGLLSKIINEVENLKLTVTNTTSMSFNNRTLDITIMAQMEMNFNKRPQDVVAKLRSIF